MLDNFLWGASGTSKMSFWALPAEITEGAECFSELLPPIILFKFASGGECIFAPPNQKFGVGMDLSYPSLGCTILIHVLLSSDGSEHGCGVAKCLTPKNPILRSCHWLCLWLRENFAPSSPLTIYGHLVLWHKSLLIIMLIAKKFLSLCLLFSKDI